MPFAARHPPIAADGPARPDGDSGFARVDARNNPLSLPAGTLVSSINLRLDKAQPTPRKGSARLAQNILINAAALELAFDLAPDVAVTSLTYAFGLVTAVAPAHGLVSAQLANLRGDGPVGWFGDFRVVVVDADTFTYTLPQDPGGAASNVIANGGPVLYDAAGEKIHALGIYRSAYIQEAREYLVAIGTSAAYLLNFDLGGIYLLPTVDSEDVTVDNDEITVDAAAPGVPTIYLTYPAGETVDDDDELSLVQAVDGLYLFRGRDPAGEWKWRKLADGAATYAAGVVTIAQAGHGFAEPQRVKVLGADQAAVNVEVEIEVVDADHWRYPIATDPGEPITGTIRVRRVKAPLVWSGEGGAFQRVPGGSNPAGPTYERLPASGIACYSESQMVAVDGRDGVQLMDVGDPNTADAFQKSFQANLGGNDAVVAVVPYYNKQLFIPCRRSLLRATIVLDATGTKIDYTQSELTLLSPTYGCKAKDSVQVWGQTILFLSSYGLHALSNLDSQDLALRALMEPLSMPVAPWFQEINWAFAHRAKSAVHDNRYFLAVPTGRSEWPNEIFVWCALTKGWESRDRYPFAINFLQTAQFAGVERLFAATREGGVFLLHEQNFSDQKPGGAEDVIGDAETRQFQWGDQGPKTVRRMLADIVLPRGGTFTATVNSFNPDRSQRVAAVASLTAGEEDMSVKRTVKMRAHYASVRFQLVGAGSRVRQLSLEAILPTLPPDSSALSSK